jgi:release factor glutamine methyltransferase
MTTVRQALEQGIALLTQAGQQSARLAAQVLLGHVLGVERTSLYAYPETRLTPEQVQQFFTLIERRGRGEPVAYLVGHREFYGLDFLVDRRVLIPRPETELLVETALSVCRQRFDAGQTPIVADIGTGSGAIPITLAVQEPRLPYLYATDISMDALEVAGLNCRRHHVEQRIRLLHGDLLTPLPESVDVFTANLPYVGTNEMDVLDPDVRGYEPHLALFSGDEGLDLLRRLFLQARQSRVVSEGAVFLLEIGYRQREPLTEIVHEVWPQAVVTFRKDYAGWDRLLQVTV